MKKIFSIFAVALAAFAFASCAGDEDDLFSQSAAERLNEASDLYSSRLTAQPNGWAMQLYPTTKDEAPYGNGYLVLMRFHKNHQVDVSMNNVLTNNVFLSDSSSWDVITDDGPVLSFDTHNEALHKFSDPDDVPQTGTSDNPNDETGTGIGGDFEFIIVDAPEDASYMMLKGKKRGTYNLLTPVEEGVDYESYLTDVKGFMSKMFPANYPTYNLLHAADSLYRFDGADDGLPSIYLDGADAITTGKFNPFLITKRGQDYYLRFRDKATYNGLTVQEFRYSRDSDEFVSVDNKDVYISGNDAISFFNSYLGTSAHRWAVTVSANEDLSTLMSDSYLTIFNQISNEFKAVNKNYYIRSLSLRNDNGAIKLSIDYSGRVPARYVDYNLTKTENSDGSVKFEYTGCDDAAQKILNRVPSIQQMIDLLCSSDYSIKGGDTNFNLTNIRLTSKSDANNWIIFGMK